MTKYRIAYESTVKRNYKGKGKPVFDSFKAARDEANRQNKNAIQYGWYVIHWVEAVEVAR